MRVATVFFGFKQSDRLAAVAQGFARGIEAQGHQVDLIEARRDTDVKLSMYQYVVIGAEQVGVFGGKIPVQVTEFLQNAGAIGGKKSFAFVLQRPIGASKALTNLMRVMEREGMFIRFSEVVRSAGEAEAIGKRLHI